MTCIDLTQDHADGTQWTLADDSHEPITVPTNATASDLLNVLREAGLIDHEEDVSVFTDDGDEPLDDLALLMGGKGASLSLCVAPRACIEVTVHYGDRFIGQQISAAVRVGRLRRQAAEQFDLDPDEAELHVLQLCDTDIRPNERRPVGTLDRNRDGEVCLDLVRVRPTTVIITVNNKPVEIHPGCRAVSEIKRLGGVAQADVLEQVVDGRLVELADDGHVQIQGREVFVSHPRDSACS